MVATVFKIYIRPIIEYNSIVWNPSAKCLIDKIENVQRKYSKRIVSISHLSYLERLSILGLEPLEIRRLKNDLIMYYKVLNCLTVIDPKIVFTINTSSRNNRHDTDKFLVKPIKRPKVLENCFSIVIL